MGSGFHLLCSRYSGTLPPTAPTADKLWKTITVTYVGIIIKSDARQTSVQLKRGAKLFTLIVLTTNHTDCRFAFILYPMRL